MKSIPTKIMVVYVELARKHGCEVVLLGRTYHIVANKQILNAGCSSSVNAWKLACEYLGYSKEYLQLKFKLGHLIEKAIHYGIAGMDASAAFVLASYVTKDYSVNQFYGKLPLTNNNQEAEKLISAFKSKIGRKPRGTWATFTKINSPDINYFSVMSDGSGNVFEFHNHIKSYDELHALLLKEEFESMYTRIYKQLLIETSDAINQVNSAISTKYTNSDSENHHIQNAYTTNLGSTNNVVGGIR
ncbi:MAG: hypothetical protein CTY35_03635 [Methylotenera sp.]|nr:MAG: hypothetical protein CTY35_03635 [Methylotenera sp.]